MALYHTHRPQDYHELIGQEYIVTTLGNQVAADHIAHAYLFSGPRGVGKTTTARILAKAANCAQRKTGEANPCNSCTSCAEITGGNAIDVMEIDAASNTGVDHVRANIIDNAQFKPTKSRYKIFIVDEVHMLSTSAFNALLKILEEPPSYVLFILATTELHKIPDTIISRCQRFQFKRVPYDILNTYLKNIAKKEGYDIHQQVVDKIIAKSEGCVRDAMSLLDQLMALGTKQISPDTAKLVLPSVNQELIFTLIDQLLKKNISESFVALTDTIADANDMLTVADDIIDLLRHLMIFHMSPTYTGSTDLGDDTRDQLRTLSKEVTGKDLMRLIDILLRRRLEIKLSPLPQLPLEMLIIEWCDDHDNNDDRTGEVMTRRDSIPAQPNLLPPRVVTVSRQDTEKIWGNFLTAVEQQSPSLVFILKMADLTEIKNNTITLNVPYAFHRDKLLDIKSKNLLQKMLSDLLQTQVSLDITVNATSEQKNKELTDLASLVGGEVV